MKITSSVQIKMCSTSKAPGNMLHGHITLPELDPTPTPVGKWSIEKNNNLIVNHIVHIFKKFLYNNGSNHFRIHTAAFKNHWTLKKLLQKKTERNFIQKILIQYCNSFNIPLTETFLPSTRGNDFRGRVLWVTFLHAVLLLALVPVWCYSQTKLNISTSNLHITLPYHVISFELSWTLPMSNIQALLSSYILSMCTYAARIRICVFVCV